jgi:hypothetical protein
MLRWTQAKQEPSLPPALEAQVRHPPDHQPEQILVGEQRWRLRRRGDVERGPRDRVGHHR